ncbi:hypothetical protein KQI84_13590 [bacterium]|nr:hypothetical protein [bacterium]
MNFSLDDIREYWATSKSFLGISPSWILGALVLLVLLKILFGILGRYTKRRTRRTRLDARQGSWVGCSTQRNRFFPKRPALWPNRGGRIELLRHPLELIADLGKSGFLLIFVLIVLFLMNPLGDGVVSGNEFLSLPIVGIFLLVGYYSIKPVVVGLQRNLWKVELEAEPLEVGGSTAYSISQRLPFECGFLSAHLVLFEQVMSDLWPGFVPDETGRVAVVYKKKLGECREFRGTRGTPILQGTLEIPEWAAHSFAAAGNRLTWAIQIDLELDHASPLIDDTPLIFPIRVAPSSSAEEVQRV